MYDVIIIGMGPAGMNAALYAHRAGLVTLILESNSPGGLINKTDRVENYLGLTSLSGSDLSFKMFEHINSLKIPYKIEEVRNIEKKRGYKLVTTTKGEYKSKTVIICTGRSPKKAGIDKEDILLGKGISYCAVCDAPLYKDKNVALIGGGNSAFEESIYLSDFAKNVYILVRKKEARADKKIQDEVKIRKNIKVMFDTSIMEVKTDKDSSIKSIILNNKKSLNVEGIFIYTGYEPKTSYLNKLGIINEAGYILTDSNMRTKAKGIYAAGDTIKKEVYQIITAASEGAIAALSAKKDINK